MDKGYKHLENQEFEEAEQFFQEVLQDFPENKTANICYNRAIGLNGQVTKALAGFRTLKQLFPDDLEVNLNLAEALMWNSDYGAAESVYQKFSLDHSENFTVQLGYANALAAQNKYAEAILHIEKACVIDPTNPSSKLSRKYIYLGSAESEKTNGRYEQSEKILDKLNLQYPEDLDILISQANLALIMNKLSKAESKFKLLQTSDINSLEGLLGMSYTSLLKMNHSNALSYAEKALKLKGNSSDQQSRAEIARINALGAQGKFREARYYLENLEVEDGKTKETEQAKARLLFWNGNYDQSISIYDSLETIYTESSDIKIAYSEVLIAINKRDSANDKLQSVISKQNHHPDATKLRDKLNRIYGKKIELNTSFDDDIANNNSFLSTARFSFSPNAKNRTFFEIGQKSSKNNVPDNARLLRLVIGNEFYFSHKNTIKGFLGINNSDGFTKSNTNFVYNLAFKSQPNKQVSVELGTQSEMQNYNADLIKSNISQRDFYLINSLNLPINLGTYAVLMNSQLSDNNSRNLIFVSLYYTLMNAPNLKAGANFSSFEFRQATIVYFSPNYYQNIEGFLQISNLDIERSSLLYHFGGAIGNQKIEESASEITKRFEIKLGYKISENSKILANYLYTDAAQTNTFSGQDDGLGYSYSRYGIELLHSF